jgi:hypothetical protein
MEEWALGRHVLTTSFMSTWKILGTMYSLLICKLIVYSQESGELNYPVPWALIIVGLSWWSGARTRPLPYPYPLVGIDSRGRPRQRDGRFCSRSSSCMIPGSSIIHNWVWNLATTKKSSSPLWCRPRAHCLLSTL